MVRDDIEETKKNTFMSSQEVWNIFQYSRKVSEWQAQTRHDIICVYRNELALVTM